MAREGAHRPTDPAPDPATDPVVHLENVSFGYGPEGASRILDGVDLTLAPGSFHFLTGPSGAGKTTVLRLLYLENRPSAGRLRLFGRDPAGLDRRGIAKVRRRVGIVFQEFRLLEHMSVADNIALPLRVAGRRLEDHRTDIEELIAWVGLASRRDAFPRALSAGEKQRAAIARAVVGAPDLILADEPTGNIDPDMGARILKLLIELHNLGKTVLVATHDLGLVRSARGVAGARILRLSGGRLLQGAREL